MNTLKTAAELNDLMDDYLIKYYDPLHTQFTLLSDFYNQRVPLGKMKTGVTVYNPPTARVQVDAAVDHLMGLGQKVHVFLWAESQEAKNLATQYEQFGTFFLAWLDRAFRVNLRRACLKNCLLFGIGVLKGPLYVPRLKAESGLSDKEFEENLRRTFPFRFSNIHPNNIFPDPSDPPQYFFEEYGRSVASAKLAWPEWTNPKNLKDTDVVTWREFWDCNQKQFFLDKEPLLNGDAEQNVYGFIPYKIGYSGLGLDSPEGKPEELAVSLIAPALSAYKIEARLKTAIADGLERGIYQQPTISKPPEQDFQLAEVPGDISVIPTDYNFENREVPKVTQDAYSMLGIVDNDEQAVIPHILEGRWPKGVTSGYMGAISVGQARIKLEGSVLAWETMISGIMDNVLDLVQNVVQESVGLMGLGAKGTQVVTLNPDKINTQTQHFNVKLDAETPEQRDQRIMLGQRLDALRQQSGGLAGLSWETICRDYYGHDPMLERQRMLVESALRNPLIMQGLAISAMQDAGMHEALQLLKEGKLLPADQGTPQQGEYEGSTRSRMRLGPQNQELGSQEEMQGVPQ